MATKPLSAFSFFPQLKFSRLRVATAVNVSKGKLHFYMPNDFVADVSLSSGAGEVAPDVATNFDNFNADMADFYSQQEAAEAAAEVEEPETEADTTDVEDEPEETEEDGTETEPEEEVQDEPEQPKETRSSRHAKLQNERDTFEKQVQELTPKVTELQTKIEKADAALARYGGVEEFVKLDEQFIQPLLNQKDPTKTVEMLSELPHGAQIRQQIVFDVLGLQGNGQAKELDAKALQATAQNQTFFVNSILKNLTGVDAKLDVEQFGLVGEWLATRLKGEDREDFLSEIKDEVETATDPNVRRLRELENQLKELTAKTTENESEPEQDEAQRGSAVGNTIVQMTQELVQKVIESPTEKLAEKYGLGKSGNDKADAANQLLMSLVQREVLAQVQSSEAVDTLGMFLMTGKKEHPAFNVVFNPYKQLCEAKAKEILRTLAPRLLGNAQPKPQAKKPAPSVKSSSNAVPSQPLSETKAKAVSFSDDALMRYDYGAL